jgi:hypothetical protein
MIISRSGDHKRIREVAVLEVPRRWQCVVAKWRLLTEALITSFDDTNQYFSFFF